MGNNFFFGSIILDVIYMYINLFGFYIFFINFLCLFYVRVFKVNSKCLLIYILSYYFSGNKIE